MEIELLAVLEKLSPAELNEAISLLLSRLAEIEEDPAVETLCTDVMAVRSGSQASAEYDG
jgi:hypothetical protein